MSFSSSTSRNPSGRTQAWWPRDAGIWCPPRLGCALRPLETHAGKKCQCSRVWNDIRTFSTGEMGRGGLNLWFYEGKKCQRLQPISENLPWLPWKHNGRQILGNGDNKSEGWKPAFHRWVCAILRSGHAPLQEQTAFPAEHGRISYTQGTPPQTTANGIGRKANTHSRKQAKQQTITNQF